MSVRYSTRRLDVREQADASSQTLTPLWARNLRDAADPRDRFRWYYEDPPDGAAEALVLEALGDEVVPEVVGCAAIGARTLVHRAGPAPAALLGDLAVDAAHRTLFPALILQRAVKAVVRERFALSYGFPSPAAVPVFERLGYATLGEMTRYARVLRHARYVRRVWNAGVLSDLAGGLVDGVSALRDRTRAPRVGAGRTFAWQEAYDPRFDDPELQGAAAGRLRFQRGAQFLSWRFGQRPGRTYRTATLGAPSRLDAYAVVEQVEATAHVRDWHGRTVSDLDSLLGALLSALRVQGVESISVWALPTLEAVTVLDAHGFVPRERGRPVIVDPFGLELATASAARDASAWWLTDADEDV